MKSTQLLLTYGLILALSTALNGQRYLFENVELTTFENCGAIRSAGKVIGYYMVYRREAPKKEKEVVLTVLDGDLNELAEKTYLETDNFSIERVAYSAGILGVETMDSRFTKGEKKLSLLNQQLEPIKEIDLERSGFEGPMMASLTGIYDKLADLVSLPNGFLSVDTKMVAQGLAARMGYQIRYVPSDPDRAGWTFESDGEAKINQGATYLASDGQIAVFGVFKRKNFNTKVHGMDILAIDLATGEEVFTYSPTEDDLPVRYLTGRINAQGITLVGQNTGERGHLYTDAPEGIDVLKLNRSGAVTQQTSLNFERDLADYFEIKGSGKVKGLGHLFVHDIGVTTDGRVLIAGEFYRTFTGKIAIREGLLLSLTPTLEVAELKLVDNGSTSMRKLSNYAGTGNSSSVIATYANVLGMFNFALLEEKPEVITTAYFSGGAEVWKERKISLYLNTLLDGKLVEDKITFDAKTDKVIMLPGKEGFLMVIEYDKRDKTLTTRLERLRL